MENELGILIQSRLDTSNSTVSQLNNDLQLIQKKLDNLNIKIDTSKMTKDVEQQMQKVNKSVNNVGKSGDNGITNMVEVDMNKLRKNHADAFKEIDKLTKHYNGAVTSIKKQGGIDLTDKDDIEKLNRYNVGIKDLEGVVRNFRINNTENGLEVVGFDEINNIEKAQTETQKLAHQMGKLREQSQMRRKGDDATLLKEQNKWINKNANDARKQTSIEKKKTDELEYQIQKAQELAKYKKQDLERRYGNTLTSDQNNQLNDYTKNMNKITKDTPNARREIDKLNTSFRGTKSSVAEAGSRVSSFGNELKTALARVNW